MKTCDICHASLGMLKKFRYSDGFICKDCYEKASNHFTETITKKSFEEIKELCEEKKEFTEDFEITGRIGNYILFDEKNGKICLLNNRINQKKMQDPEFYTLDEISGCRIEVRPAVPLDELQEKMKKKDAGTVNQLKVTIDLQGGRQKDITLIENPVRIKSFAMKQSFSFAERITEAIGRLRDGDAQESAGRR
ncbi:DUF4428 domain-containing protein [Anaerostipes sp.]|uniref:DUF4428 domain-containing protein n=1 Tax=Anaerostipes sp. TaxID=1872530 RepID=UPI0025BB7D20|nr:DUF4428 domain-containing protein [Anaerostipes sp.]MBS7008643.1 DUF4428 domain-containing protein [Anaerostipes sp.]